MKKLILPFVLLLFTAIGAKAQCHAYYRAATDTTLTAHFYDSSITSSSHAFYYWKFGDSTWSTSKNPMHTYSHAGTYTVCEYIVDSTKSCTDSICQNITVGPKGHIGCAASFTSFVDTLKGIQFSGSSSGTHGTVRYMWYFGDGDSSSLKDPLHKYTSTGTYYVCLYVFDSGCTSSYCGYVAYSTGSSCTAFFYAATDTTLTAHFTDSSAISGTSHEYYSWDFGDGHSDTIKNPTHTYSSAGFYDVFEYITDSAKTCSSFYHRRISVGSKSLLCLAYFTATTDTSKTAHFYDSSTIGGRSREHYKYTFGDGHSDTTSKNVTYTYASAGTYTVCEYIYDSAGTCSSNYCRTITVGYSSGSGCSAFFGSYEDSTLTAQFFDSSYASSAHPTYTWYFGDGDTINTKNPKHTYAHAGTYYVCEYIFDHSKGCSSSYCDSITVGAHITPCSAHFTIDSIDSVRHIIYITNHSTGASSYMWYFGDMDSSNSATPTHTYSTAGIYNLCLYILCSGSYSYYCDTINGASTHIRSGIGYTIKVKAASTDINETTLLGKNLRVFPNPVNSTLNVYMPENVSKGTLTVKNMLGQQVTSQEVGTRAAILNMSTLAPGMYLIQLQTTQGSFTTRIVKQ